MKREDISQALRFVAMGRTNHQLVEALVDTLVLLLDKPKAIEPAVLTVEITEPKRRVKAV